MECFKLVLLLWWLGINGGGMLCFVIRHVAYGHVVTAKFAWFDIWVGLYIDPKDPEGRALYWCPVPFLLLKVEGERTDSCAGCVYLERDVPGDRHCCFYSDIDPEGVNKGQPHYCDKRSER